MALGPTRMSSATSIPVPTATDNNSDASGQRGSNYFFGFLITFVILFLVFVGCGIGSRRRLLASRADGVLIGDPWGGGLKANVEQKKPAFYEYPLAPPVEVDQWEYTMPLSATVLRSSSKTILNETGDGPRSFSPPHSDLEAADSGRTTPFHIFPGVSLQEWIARRRDPPEPDESHEPPEAMSVAVMIAMPCSSEDRRATFQSTDFVRLAECQIGTATVPWHTELSRTPGPVVLARTETTPMPPPVLTPNL